MTAKKDTTKFVLVSGAYDEPLLIGTKTELADYVKETADWNDVEYVSDWKVYELGREVAVSVDTEIQVSIG